MDRIIKKDKKKIDHMMDKLVEKDKPRDSKMHKLEKEVKKRRKRCVNTYSNGWI